MKAIIQRVNRSSVSVENKIINKIDKGLNILIGFEEKDTEEIIDKFVKKIIKLRIFENRFSKNIIDIKGEILLIPNFTIPAITKKGTKPNFQNSMKSHRAKIFYEKMLEEFNKHIPTKGGVFGADMKVEILNDGPVTLIIEL
jgi:D-tyrosyl-tRNA(Tyr) deacylase